MQTIIEMQNDVAAFKAKRDDLIKAQGLATTTIEAKNELVMMESRIEIDRKKMARLLEERELLIKGVTATLCIEIDKLLSTGSASIRIGDGSVDIGWVIDETYHPYSNLSGGERFEFVNALSQVLCSGDNPLTHAELAETGDRVESVLHTILSSQKGQVIACTCNWQEEYNCEGWTKIEL